MQKVTLINYGVGNINAFAHIYRRLNILVEIATSYSQIESATHLVLPGVGAFDWAMTKLNDSGMRDALDNQVLGKNTPILGVCVGMQMMAEGSEEGRLAGLGWINANVTKLCLTKSSQTPLPHMGWNDVNPKRTDSLFDGTVGSRFYFLHSYVVEPFDATDVLATTDYGSTFVCAVQRGNVYGTQFHPEKSHKWGISLLSKFVGLEKC